MKTSFKLYLGLSFMLLFCNCSFGQLQKKEPKKLELPVSYYSSLDTNNVAKKSWKNYFNDSNLSSLIDSALLNNQELNIITQEINIANNEIRARKGAYLPFVALGGASRVEKVGRYTSQGASDNINDILPGKRFPEPLPNFLVGAVASWEIDIWKKLRNSKKSAVYNYLSTVDGKNFMVTGLISELATNYYELIALDNQLKILRENIVIQENILNIIRLEKSSARLNELAVKRFEAEVLKNKSRQYFILQQIREKENRINFLVGRLPKPVIRDSQSFLDLKIDTILSGLPSQLLENRPDIRKAENQMYAAKLDVKVAKAEFYPNLTLRASSGYEAFNPQYLLRPNSLIYSLAGELLAPLINRNAIKANYYSASSKQVQSVYNFQRSILQAHIEVVNNLSNLDNLRMSYELKEKQVLTLVQSIDISTMLFKSARADYIEVLLTQRDALESRFELVEIRMKQLSAKVSTYRSLGGGWR